MVIAAFGDFQVSIVLRGGEHAAQLLGIGVDVAKAPGLVPLQHVVHGGNNIAVAAAAKDTVNLRQFLHQLVLIALTQAAGHQDLADFPLVFQQAQLQNFLNGLAFGAFNKAAGVDDGNIAVFHLSGDLISCLMQQAQHLFGIHLVFGTAQGYHCNFFPHSESSNVCFLFYRSRYQSSWSSSRAS